MSETKYCIKSKMALGAFVERITFNDCGVSMEFTRDMGKAAKVSVRDAADALAKCVPGGTVHVHDGSKPAIPK